MSAPARVLAAVAAASLCACQASTPRAASCGPLGLDAGASRAVATRAVVRLAGSVAGADGGIGYQWRLASVPAGSGAALSTSTAADASFTADVAGVYVATLFVRDACGADATGVVVITATDEAPAACTALPVAAPGPDRTVSRRALVRLAGQAPGATGAPAFEWMLAVVPPGSAATLSSATSAGASFAADAPGVYVASLVVRDDCGASAPAIVLITAVDHAPLATAGPDRTVAPGATVALDGAGGTDADGDDLSFQWSLILRPPGSVATLTSTTARAPSFVADLPGSYLAQLVVGDGALSSAPADVLVYAAPPPACSSTPLAVASPGQHADKRAIVTLAGSAEGAQGGVSYRWQLVSAPAGSLAMVASSTAATAMLFTDLSGTYVASLTVRDACGASAPTFTVITVADRAPVASAGAGQTLMPGGRATLDGSGSSDPDQDPLAFAWSLTSRPAGSRAELSSGSAPSPTLVPDLYGTYVAQLLVSDGELTSPPATVVIQVGITGSNGTCAPAPPPTAAAGPDQSLRLYYSAAQLDGTGSTTGRPDPLTYRWSLTDSPPGSAPALASSTAARPVLSLSQPGSYQVALVVNDGCVDSATSTVTVTRPNLAPTVYLHGPYAQVPILVPVQVQSTGYDWDGQGLTYLWQLTGAPAGSLAALSSSTATQITLTPDLPGTYTYTLAVSDGLATSTASGGFVATNLPPAVSAGGDRAVFIGAAVLLDGSGSSDASGRPLGFTWSLQAPTGSAAALFSRTSATSSFTPDRPGRYLAQLTVSAGGLVSTGTAAVAVWPAPSRLGHRVLDAAYSTALDRLVMVSADPNALYLYDPRGPAETLVPLPSAPSSLSLSPDGRSAAVGHLNALSIVDLAAATTTQLIPVSADVGGVALGDNGFAYVVPRNTASERVHLIAVPLGPGAQPSFTSALVGPAVARIRPSAGTLYLTAAAPNYYSSLPIEEYALPGGAPLLATPAGATYLDTCGGFWLSRAGDRLFTRCGAALVASSIPSADLTGSVPLARGANYGLFLRHLDDSAAAGELSAISSPDAYYYSTPLDDQTLRRWSADGLVAREVLPFPTEPFGGASFAWSGRYVFYRSDGSERYVILQLAPGAGALHDFAVATY